MKDTNKINEAISKKVTNKVAQEAKGLYALICEWAEKNPVKVSPYSDESNLFTRHYDSFQVNGHLSAADREIYQPFVDAFTKMMSQWKQSRHDYLFEKAANEIIEKANIFLPESLK